MVKIIKTNYITSFFIQNILLKYKNKVNLWKLEKLNHKKYK